MLDAFAPTVKKTGFSLGISSYAYDPRIFVSVAPHVIREISCHLSRMMGLSNRVVYEHSF
jgi:hypothetical protein